VFSHIKPLEDEEEMQTFTLVNVCSKGVWVVSFIQSFYLEESDGKKDVCVHEVGLDVMVRNISLLRRDSSPTDQPVVTHL
jgi:hypothetical protein